MYTRSALKTLPIRSELAAGSEKQAVWSGSLIDLGSTRWSRGWFDGFKRRKGIVFKATNKKRSRKNDEEDDDDDGDNEGEYIQIHVDG